MILFAYNNLIERQYSHRLAPIIGTVIGFVLALRFSNHDAILFRLICGAIVGFISGAIIFVLTHPKNKEAGPEKNSPAKTFWAVVGLLLSVVPVVGFVFALISFGVTSSCRSWVRVVSLAAIALSIVSLTVSLVVLVAANGP